MLLWLPLWRLDAAAILRGAFRAQKNDALILFSEHLHMSDLRLLSQTYLILQSWAEVDTEGVVAPDS